MVGRAKTTLNGTSGRDVQRHRLWRNEGGAVCKLPLRVQLALCIPEVGRADRSGTVAPFVTVEALRVDDAFDVVVDIVSGLCVGDEAHSDHDDDCNEERERFRCGAVW